MKLQVLLVEDNPAELTMYLRDLPAVFLGNGLEADLHPTGSFDDAKKLAADPSRRYDLILSDTFRGAQDQGDAAVIDLVNSYRAKRFCPLVVFSASTAPAQLQTGAFVMWADKATPNGIESVIDKMLKTGVPQAARQLHDDLDQAAGSYLWDFLETNWSRLVASGHTDGEILSRLVRRRAALQLAEMETTQSGVVPVSEVHGLEFYMYPPLSDSVYSLGELIRNKSERSDMRVVLTPHCYLAVQPNQQRPRADFVRVVKALPAKDVLGPQKLADARAADQTKRNKTLSGWTTPPSGATVGTPAGRYWYLPGFLDIPHSYCDFFRVDSLPFDEMASGFEKIAVLSPPYAESLQACWKMFDSSVGIPNLRHGSAAKLLD